MKEEFEKLVAAGKLSKQQIEPLVSLTESRYCMHRSWGFGKITTVDTVFARFVIDFPSKKGHPMDLAFAADSLKPIPPDHILARKLADLKSLQQMAALHHLDLIKLVLQSYDGRATLDQIQQALVPDVITSDWKKWWEAAKRELKKDGHFQLPVKKSDPVLYQAKETSLQDRLMGEFRAAKGLKARLNVAHELLKSISDLSDPKTAGEEAIAALNTEIISHQRTQPAVALEGIFVRDDLRNAIGSTSTEKISTNSFWLQETKFGQVLEALPAAKHRRALESFKEANPNLWQDALIGTVNNVSTKLAGEMAHALIQGGKFEQLKETLARLINQHQASSDLLLWLAKERSDDTYADILGPEVFRAMLTSMERDQFNEKRTNKLRDFISDNPNFLVELLESADIDVMKDCVKALQLSPIFDDMSKRSLFGHIVKGYPALQSMISGEATKQEATLQVSWESLERRKNEYAEMVQKKIPANSKEIAIARSYGDLRENHEYKAAKEMQKILMRQKSELETQLVKARGTDFANVKTDAVGIGTKVGVTDLNANQSENFEILGAWDSEPEKGVISYLTPVAQALLNKKVGEEVELELEGARKRLRIDSIAAARVA
ncbi:MAG: GreA/GreB family elongation factor [Verrucomicrobiota bacterium]